MHLACIDKNKLLMIQHAACTMACRRVDQGCGLCG